MIEATKRKAAPKQQAPLVVVPLPNWLRRMETGSVQFGDDWPGVFIRGDNAMAYALCLRGVAEIIECNDPGHAIAALQLRSLADELSGCQAV